jgi:CRISPR-associated endonuclease/helicase Cas3
MVGWLILTHHKLPAIADRDSREMWQGRPAKDFDETLARFSEASTKTWGYSNRDRNAEAGRCLSFSRGLPGLSREWTSISKKWAIRAVEALPLSQEVIRRRIQHVVLHHARTALMLGDHYFSSLDADPNIGNSQDLFANTNRQTGIVKQSLEEHLLGVTQQGLHTAHWLPAIEGSLPTATGVFRLRSSSPAPYKWQDLAVKKIRDWRATEQTASKNNRFGFFLVNMAGTGKGKTFANAKIMRALSEDGESLRYILALGLRSLTLQTGDEYRTRIGLDRSELAVLIGSKAVLELHAARVLKGKETSDSGDHGGSESQESLYSSELDYDTELSSTDVASLNAVFQREKDRAILYAPVLACTIDHLMGATETTRGGGYILPALRLMSSDLVIDEIDDFDGDDLVAISRLVHLAGILGRKVIISSATIPPNLAEGLFFAYERGRRMFADSRGMRNNVACAWTDEFTTRIASLSDKDDNGESRVSEFRRLHQKYVESRVRELKKQPTRRKAEIRRISDAVETDESSEPVNEWFRTIQSAIVDLHRQNHEKTEAFCVSAGVVRVANIPPCIALSRFLMTADWPEDVDVRVMSYHSSQVLLLRSALEEYLDDILKHRRERFLWDDPLIRSHTTIAGKPNMIFVVVATPVEEVGRDHDFDWAVIEPSSFRSIIQLAGRVLRHREWSPEHSNLILLDYNHKGWKQHRGAENIRPVFVRPGYESPELQFSSHALSDLVNDESIRERIDAVPRIKRRDSLEPTKNLVEMEHYWMERLLSDYSAVGPETANGWISDWWWLTALPQQFTRFRDSKLTQMLYVVPQTEDPECTKFEFAQKDDFGVPRSVEKLLNIHWDSDLEVVQQRLWNNWDYQTILENVAAQFAISPYQAACRFGQIDIEIQHGGSNQFVYSPHFGLVRSH